MAWKMAQACWNIQATKYKELGKMATTITVFKIVKDIDFDQF